MEVLGNFYEGYAISVSSQGRKHRANAFFRLFRLRPEAIPPSYHAVNVEAQGNMIFFHPV